MSRRAGRRGGAAGSRNQLERSPPDSSGPGGGDCRAQAARSGRQRPCRCAAGDHRPGRGHPGPAALSRCTGRGGACAHAPHRLDGHAVRQRRIGPLWAAVVVSAWSAQPLAIFAGSRSLAPVDLWSTAPPARSRASSCDRRATRTARRLSTGGAACVEIRRPAYQAQLAAGTDRFFEPRRTSCPWCGSIDLRRRLRERPT